MPNRVVGPIARAWDEYAELLLPKNAPDVQKQETKRAFYHGAARLFDMITHELDAGEEPTDADLAKMDTIDAEIKQWLDDLKSGRA